MTGQIDGHRADVSSLSEGVVFVSRFKSGCQVWEVTH
jgi:hypothetical protein